MRRDKEVFEKLRKALIRAYHHEDKGEVDELWQARVMGYIRTMGPAALRVSYFEFFQAFLWRLVPAVCILIVIFAAIFVQMDVISDYEVAKILMGEPVEFALFQPVLNG